MKTKMYSNSLKAALAVMFSFVLFISANAQSFLTPDPDSPTLQAVTEDVRDGNVVVYTLGNHTLGQEYRWEVTGGTITGGAGSGPSVLDFTANANSITVTWDDATPGAITSFAGQIQVQKTAGGCPSQVHTLPINIWRLPTATITDADTDFCSGGATAGTITVDLTGAPDDGALDGFTVNYEYVAPDIEDGAGVPQDGITGTETINAGSLTIPLPANLINTEATADRTFTVNLTLMTDDFDDQNGTWTAAGGSYEITVHPVLETGDIVSDSSLTRR